MPDPSVVGTVFTLSPNAGSSNPVVLQSLTPAVCAVDTDTSSVSFLAEGTCPFTADRAGNGNYEPAPQLVVTVTVTKQPQSITFDPALPSEALPNSCIQLTLPLADGTVRTTLFKFK